MMSNDDMEENYSNQIDTRLVPDFFSKLVIENPPPARFVISVIKKVDENPHMVESDDEDNEVLDGEILKTTIDKIVANPNDKQNYPYKIKSLVYKTVEECCIPVEAESIITNSNSNIQSFLNKLKDNGFDKNDKEYKIENCVSVSMGLNRMLSVSNRINKSLVAALNENIVSNIHHKVFGFYWKPRWFNKANRSEVSYEEVRNFYRKLKKINKSAANIFQKTAESITVSEMVKKKQKPVEKEVRIVPFQHLREYAMLHKKTKKLIDLWQREDESVPIYLSLIDDDTLSFNGIYSAYCEKLKSFKKTEIPAVMSTGYEFHGNKPYQLATFLDRQIRILTSKLCPSRVYFPEPNTCILIEKNYKDNEKILRETFINPKKGKGRDMESAALLTDLMKKRPNAIFLFFDGNPILTTLPDRFCYKAKKKKGKAVDFTEGLSIGFLHDNAPTEKDIGQLAMLSQSHLKRRNWWNNLYVNGGIDHKNTKEARSILIELYNNSYKNVNDLKNSCQMKPQGIRSILLAYAETQAYIYHIKKNAQGEAQTYTAYLKSIQQPQEIQEKIDFHSDEMRIVDLFKCTEFIAIIDAKEENISKIIDIALEIWENDNDLDSVDVVECILPYLANYYIDDIIKIHRKDSFYLTFMAEKYTYEQLVIDNFDNPQIDSHEFVQFFIDEFVEKNDILQALYDDYDDEYDLEEKNKKEMRFEEFRDILQFWNELDWEWERPSSPSSHSDCSGEYSSYASAGS